MTASTRVNQMRTFRDPSDVHAPAASYSHQVELTDVRLVLLSGQIGMTPDGAIPSDPYEQLDVAFENVRSNLAAAGLGVDDIVKLKLYIVGDWDPAARREALRTFLGEHRPTMTVVGAAALGAPEMLVEVEVTAAQ